MSHHEAHEEHEESEKFILLPSCSSRPSWWKLSFLLWLRIRCGRLSVVNGIKAMIDLLSDEASDRFMSGIWICRKVMVSLAR